MTKNRGSISLIKKVLSLLCRSYNRREGGGEASTPGSNLGDNIYDILQGEGLLGREAWS